MAESAKKNSNERVYRMVFGEVYPLYVNKAERKGRTQAEVDEILEWLTGYDKQAIQALIAEGRDLEAFFEKAPRINPNISMITGSICGYRVEEIEDKIIRQVRCMDKLIDELAKGRAMEKILRK